MAVRDEEVGLDLDDDDLLTGCKRIENPSMVRMLTITPNRT